MTALPELSYTRPRSLTEAITALKRQGARAYAGGTDILVALAHRQPWVRAVTELVDIKDLAAARGITNRSASLRIGALTTAAELATHPAIGRHARALAEAAGHTAAPALRRRGTIGGNLGTPHPAGDLTIALLALGATVELVGGDGRRRRVTVGQYLRPSTARSRLVLAVHVPKCPGSAFEKLGARRGFSRSIVAVAVALGEPGGVAIGGTAQRPFAANRTAAALHRGDALVDALAADGLPPAHRQLLAVLTARAHRRAQRR